MTHTVEHFSLSLTETRGGSRQFTNKDRRECHAYLLGLSHSTVDRFKWRINFWRSLRRRSRMAKCAGCAFLSKLSYERVVMLTTFRLTACAEWINKFSLKSTRPHFPANSHHKTTQHLNGMNEEKRVSL